MNLVKICGLTRVQDALLAAREGAFAIGYIFWPGSKRFVSLEQAKAISAALKAEGFTKVKRVGVFVNPTHDEIDEARRECDLTTVQLHGEESEEFMAIEQQKGECWKAVRLQTKAELADYQDLKADALLLDAFLPGHYGGTGVLANWELIDGLKKIAPVILSGGLNPSNVAEAARLEGVYALDLSSGVETQAGIKDPEKIKALFKALSTEESQES